MSNLITQARALSSLNGQSLNSDELDILDDVIASTSAAIETYCRRSFAVVDFDERHDGQDEPVLLLNFYPILAIGRVACEPTPVLRISNTSPDVQRATVRVSSAGVSLTRVASGVVTVDSIAFTSAVTLTALADAIVALGNGWTASVLRSEDSLRASADLGACPGTWAARAVPADLRIHLREILDYDLDSRIGLLRHPLGWPGGCSAIRVVYSAGYAAVPDDVQEACAQLTAQFYWQTKRDPGLGQESVLSALSRKPVDGWLRTVRELLAPYRRMPRL